MFEEIKAYRLRCDGCGQYLNLGEADEGTIFDSTENAWLWATEDYYDENWEEIEGKHYCYGCSSRWCEKCDDEIKPVGGKCPSCGHVNEKIGETKKL